MTAARLVFFVALRQLGARKGLNGIAVLGVTLGVITLLTLTSIMQGFEVKFTDEMIRVSPHVVVSNRQLATAKPMLGAYVGGPVAADVSGDRPSEKVGRVERPYDVIKALEAMPDVEAACANLTAQAIASIGSQTLGVEMRGVRPLDQDRCTPLAIHITQGSWLSLAAARDGIALGIGVAEKLGAKLGDRIAMGIPGGQSESLVVVAIFNVGIPPIDAVRVYTNLNTAQSVLGRPNDVGHIEVRLHEPFESKKVARRIEGITGYKSEAWEETNANFLALFDLQDMIANIVIGAVLTVGGFGILSTQIMIVLQKTKDIAILRSIGFRRSDILGIVIIQGAIVAVLGGALGDVLGYLVVDFVGTLPVKTDGLVKSNHLHMHRDPAYYVYGAAFALFVGLLASVMPALRASRVQPVAVLRGQIG
jgi:lipoprotein-releasing system permease protein